jgi:hypothetical protein
LRWRPRCADADGRGGLNGKLSFQDSLSLFSLANNSIRLAKVIIYDVYGLSPVCLRYLIQYHLSADTESDLSGSEVLSLRRVQEDLPNVPMGQSGRIPIEVSDHPDSLSGAGPLEECSPHETSSPSMACPLPFAVLCCLASYKVLVFLERH